MPSLVTSFTAFQAIGLVFLLRCGFVAFPLFIASSCYALLQWPIYVGTVIDANLDIRWYIFLSVLKLGLAGLVYLYYAVFSDFRPLTEHLFPDDASVKQHVANSFKKWGGIVQAFVIALIVALFVSFLKL